MYHASVAVYGIVRPFSSIYGGIVEVLGTLAPPFAIFPCTYIDGEVGDELLGGEGGAVFDLGFGFKLVFAYFLDSF
jgi:hypothetical protein